MTSLRRLLPRPTVALTGSAAAWPEPRSSITSPFIHRFPEGGASAADRTLCAHLYCPRRRGICTASGTAFAPEASGETLLTGARLRFASLEYARYRGEVKLDLTAVPIVPNWSMSSIPERLGVDAVRQVAGQHRPEYGGWPARLRHPAPARTPGITFRRSDVSRTRWDQLEGGASERSRQEWSAQRPTVARGSR